MLIGYVVAVPTPFAASHVWPQIKIGESEAGERGDDGECDAQVVLFSAHVGVLSSHF